MRKLKSVLALVLTLVMLLGCMSTASAAWKTPSQEIAGKPTTESSDKSAKEAKLLGYKDPEFNLNNTYHYADDEIVRAIVLLEGDCEADVAAAGTEKAAAQRVKLVNEHNTVFKAMKGIDYELKYEFTRLLNGFSCDIAYGDLDAVAAIDGVASVHIANAYAEPEFEKASDTKMSYANYLMDNAYVNELGYDGAGIVIAVLDTGLNLEHEAFSDFLGWTEEFGTLTKADVEAADTYADGKYISSKVPFAYDYADLDDDVTDYNGHGTHVSGIATGFAGYLTEESEESYAVTFSGAAPAAQLLSMKIFHNDQGGTTSDIYFYALEDAYTLGADVVNMSIGSQNGFTYDASLETEVFGNIYERLSDAGVILSVAAGNEYSMAYYSTSYEGYQGCIGPDYQDYGTVANPSTYTGNVSVASVENYAYPDYVINIDGSAVTYNDSCTDGEHGWIDTLGGKTYDYVALVSAEGTLCYGYQTDYTGVDVTGKIVVVSRGDITFEEKIEFAADAGAIGCIVVNNDTGIISMQIETFEIPAISLQQSALDVLAPIGKIEIPTEMQDVENPNAGLMSEFSNWGTSPMLTLDPAISAVGGMVYSSVPGGTDTYEVYSGTSMAAPNMTGTYANVLSAIYSEDPTISKAEAAELAKTLLYGSTYIVQDADGVAYSPRKQGAGLASSYYAIANYLESGYIANPLQELGDDPSKSGVYVMKLEVENRNDYELCYKDLQTYVMCDYLYTDAYGEKINILASDYVYNPEYDENYATVTYEVGGEKVDSFTVPAGSFVTVKVTIELSDEIMEYFDDAFPNGNFIEGYVFFDEYYTSDGTEEWGGSTNATFLGFYGDWTKGSVLEETDFMDIVEVDNWLNTTAADDEGNTYADYGYNWASAGILNFYTMPKIAYIVDGTMSKAYAFAGNNMLGYTDYYAEHIGFSTPKTDGTYNYAEAIYMQPYQLRNARHLIMTVTNKATGEVYYVDDTEYLPKAYYDEESGWTSSGVFYWDGTDTNGNYVPSGTVATITYDAVLPYGDTEIKDIWSFDVTVDYTAPVIESVVVDEDAGTVTVTASDENYLQGIYLADSDYSIIDAVAVSSDVKGQSFTATFDITGIDACYVTALDYATNETEKWTPMFEGGDKATLTFIDATGTATVDCVTGDMITFPAADGVEGYEFMFWVTEEVEYADDETIWDIPDPWYFEDDTMLITETEYTFYALYAAVEVVELDQPNFFYTTEDKYLGDWAIVGWNLDADYNFITDDPIALNASAGETRIADNDAALIGEYYIEFYTGDESVRFTFEEIGEEGYVTIKNVASGKYLAVTDDLKLTYTDTASINAQWCVYTAGNEVSVHIENVGVANAVLVYDDEAQKFAVYDDSIPYYGEYAPSEWFYITLYRCVDTESIYLYYTTDTTSTPFVNPFSDVYSSDWYFDYVMAAAQAELVNGYTDGTFRPAKSLTRAEAAMLLYRLSGSPEVTATASFSDLPNEWYRDAIAWAQQTGVVTGYPDGTFRPDESVTREQFVTMVWRLEGKPEATGTLQGFADTASVSEYAKAAFAWAIGEGIINGITSYQWEGVRLAPQDNIKRCEVAKILCVYCSLT